jgi:ElaB/YqjD/DUF883 family membrane-anchored ribosome-binding protein
MSSSHKSHAVNRVHDTVREMKDTAVENAESTADTVKRVASDTADAVRERAADLMDHGKAKASEAADQVVDHVKEHTGSSLLIAAGIGFLLGLVLLRRRDD